MSSVTAFFNFAKERHSIYIRRKAGVPRTQWTADPVLQQYRFTNVFRELDRTTVWFRENVRNQLGNSPETLLATVIFRWFNRIQTGEALFSQYLLHEGGNRNPFTIYCETGNVAWLKSAILAYCGKGPYVTGSYIIKTPDGMNKLDGVLWCIEKFMHHERSFFDAYPETNRVVWQVAAAKMRAGHTTLEWAWDWLRKFPFLGDFMAYEIVTDLRHTPLLCNAPDILSWANPGPGAMRGLNRIHGRPLTFKQPKQTFIKEMLELRFVSLDAPHWPTIFRNPASLGLPGSLVDWPSWEMREVEHTLCEFDKYERARLGEGRPRQVFR